MTRPLRTPRPRAVKMDVKKRALATAALLAAALLAAAVLACHGLPGPQAPGARRGPHRPGAQESPPSTGGAPVAAAPAAGTGEGVDVDQGPAGLTISGTVRGDGGEPIAGAEVRAVVAEGWHPGALAFAFLDVAPAAPADGAASPVARSASDGTFRIDSLLPRHHLLMARKEGWLEGRAGPVEAGSAAIAIRLRRGSRILGRAVDEVFRPAPGARVLAWIAGSVRETEAAADGRFELAGLPEGRHVVAAQSADGRSSAFTIAGAWGSAADLGDLRLRPAGRIHGRIIDAEGTPVAGAAVAAELAEASTGGDAHAVARTASASDGTFAIEVPVATAFDIRVTPEAHRPALVPAVEAGSEALEIAVDPGIALAGEVVEQASGAPLAGAAVVLEAAGLARRTVTRPGGNFSLYGLPAPGEVADGALAVVSVEHPGHAPVRRAIPMEGLGLAPLRIELEPDPGDEPDGAPVDSARLEGARVVEGESGDRNSRREGEHTFRALVIDHRGMPLEGARIAVRRLPEAGEPSGLPAENPEAPEAGIEAFAIADAEGFAAARRLVAGAHVIEAAAAGFETTTLFVTLPRDVEIAITLARLAELRVAVRDGEAGAPLLPSRASLSPLRDEGSPEPAAALAPSAVQLAPGEAIFRGVPAGRWELEIEAGGRLPWRQAVAIGTADLEVTVLLERGARLAGKVLDRETGRPVAGARIACRSADPAAAAAPEHSPREARSDAEGRFAIAGIAPGRWEIAVLHPRYAASGPVVVEAADAGASQAGEVTVRLAPAGVLEGFVALASPEDADHQNVLVRPLASEETAPFAQAIPIAADGTFSIRLAAGTYLAELYPSSGASTIQEVHIQAHSTETLLFEERPF